MQPLWIRLVIGIFIFLIFSAGALVSLLRPQEIQKRAVETSSRQLFNPFREWIKTPAYLVSLRLGGAICAMCALVLAFAIVRMILRR